MILLIMSRSNCYITLAVIIQTTTNKIWVRKLHIAKHGVLNGIAAN